MRLVFGHDAAVLAWVLERHGVRTGGRPCDAWGVVDGSGVLRGAFVLTFEHDRTMELHVYGTTSNDTVRQMFQAVFGPWRNCYRLQIRTRKSNKAIRKAAPKFGFQFEGVHKHFYGPGEHALCFYMTPATCRWIRNDGQPL